MIPYHQPPVHSPLSLRAIAAGAAAAMWPPRADPDELGCRIRAAHGAAGVLLTDSGTSALRLAMHATRNGADRAPVAIPAYACYDVATAAIGAGVPTLLYDVEPSTLRPDLESLRETLRRGAGTVVLAPLYGVAVELEDAAALSRGYGAMVVVDAAQAAGVRIGGRACSAVGSLAVLSFGRGKGTTGGGGGALLSMDAAGVDAIRRIAPSGRGDRGWRELSAAALQLGMGRSPLYAIPASLPFLGLGTTRYREPWAPRPISAASTGILSRTWELAECEIQRRRSNARRLGQRCASNDQLRAVGGRWDDGGFLRLPVVTSPASRTRSVDERAARLGIMNGYPRALADLPALRPSCLNHGDDFPGARLLAAGLFTLPTHGLVREPHMQRLERWIDGVT